jgi:hypothetical protein
MASGITHTLRGVVNSARCYGLLAAAGYVFDEVRVGRAERAERFDERYASATAGKIYPWQLPDIAEAAASGDIYPYEATPAWLLRKIIHSLPIDPSEFTFIDLGSGKGRILLAASEFSFSRIIGIEISQALNNIAVSNISHHANTVAARSAYALHCMNAAHYEFEAEPLVVFLFNPFGKDTFDAVVSRLEDSLRTWPRDVCVIYLNPRFEKRLQRSPLFRRLKSEGSRLRPWRRYVVYRSFRPA